jgi:hypothetical protein
MIILKDIPVDVEVNAILSRARIAPDSSTGHELIRLIDEVRPAIKPKAVYRPVYIEAREDRSIEIAGVRLTSRVLRVNLDRAERVFPFVATCGAEVEAWSQQYQDMLLQYVFDMFKEQLLRRAIQYLREQIQRTYAPGRLSTMNPGSLQDWPLREQQQLFALLGDVKQAIGVELAESWLMSPVKSVSGLLFPAEVGFENCQLCPRENCPGRRAPYDRTLWATRFADIESQRDVGNYTNRL